MSKSTPLKLETIKCHIPKDAWEYAK